MTWIKMIKIIFHVFDSSNDSSQVIWVKPKFNSTNIFSDQTKTKNLVRLTCDSSQITSWFKLGESLIRVTYLDLSQAFSTFTKANSEKKMRFHDSSQGCVWIKSWFELRTWITWIIVFIQITNFWLESFYVEF